ncbi:hypothetical protein Anapl_07437 [Anas platyrhynchos]|uniref:Uncharacterized protein n=1 Tax=Anas platyrhynchos TaxID=8839 RepID=R0L7G0_ANAPL|nr:hypothetical protein Anapl_07437 [Anas platyrhynchos]
MALERVNVSSSLNPAVLCLFMCPGVQQSSGLAAGCQTRYTGHLKWCRAPIFRHLGPSSPAGTLHQGECAVSVSCSEYVYVGHTGAWGAHPKLATLGGWELHIRVCSHPIVLVPFPLRSGHGFPASRTPSGQFEAFSGFPPQPATPAPRQLAAAESNQGSSCSRQNWVEERLRSINTCHHSVSTTAVNAPQNLIGSTSGVTKYFTPAQVPPLTMIHGNATNIDRGCEDLACQGVSGCAAPVQSWSATCKGYKEFPKHLPPSVFWGESVLCNIVLITGPGVGSQEGVCWYGFISKPNAVKGNYLLASSKRQCQELRTSSKDCRGFIVGDR